MENLGVFWKNNCFLKNLTCLSDVSLLTQDNLKNLGECEKQLTKVVIFTISYDKENKLNKKYKEKIED